VTISATTARTLTNGNGSTTAFAFGFPYRASADLVVILQASDGTESVRTEGTHYTVAGVSNTGTGGFDSATINMVTAPASGEKLLVLRATAATQPLDASDGGSLTAANIEGALDRLTLAVQTALEILGRVAQFKRSTAAATPVLPEPSASRLLGWDASGVNLANYSTTTLAVGAATSAFIATLLDDADQATARTTLGVRWLEGSALAVNFASIANGANSVVQTVTVTGAVLGDFVSISSSATLSGLLAVGYVSAADTVSFFLINQSGGAVDLPAQDFYARVWKRGS